MTQRFLERLREPHTSSTSVSGRIERNSHRKFLSEMSSLMGLAPDGAEGLASADAFHGPAGLMCRLRFSESGGAVMARPEVLLPLPARELMGCGVVRLLSMQEALALELGWYLGVSSEGLLQLSPLAWSDSPQAAVSALDLGQAVGMETLHALLEDEPMHDVDDAETLLAERVLH